MNDLAERDDAPEWQAPPGTLETGGEEVHVWRILLRSPDLAGGQWLDLLSEDERERAGRFHFRRDRARFIGAHACLRQVLSRYLGEEPGRLRFRTNEHGKPLLAGEAGSAGLEFNLSHSHEVALVAVAFHRRVGVDVERIRPELAGERIARRFFSPGETEALLSLPAPARAAAFFRCWTRKEAFLKARGEGLTLRLDQFDVSLLPGKPAALLATRPDGEEASNWTLHHLEPAPGYAGALAVEGQLSGVRCWRWEGGRQGHRVARQNALP